MTRAILIVTVASFVAQIMIRGYEFRMAMIPSLAADGEWWRFLTPALVHGGGLHLLMNMYVLFMIGPAVEQRFGPRRYLTIYVLSAIGGAILSFALNDPRIFGVGASGAILGLIGAIMADLYQRRSSPSARMQLEGMWRWLGMIFGIGIAFQVLAEVGVFGLAIDNYAHAGGLIVGAAVGFGLGADGTKRQVAGIPVMMAVLIFFAGLAIWRIAALTGF